MNLKGFFFTNGWTLFLDRDGVINRRIPGGYVTNWDDFHFVEGAREAISSLSAIFERIIVVSNQQGVGKGQMSLASLAEIDRRMKEEIVRAGGKIDAAYYSPYLESENHPDRKPSTGMASKAKEDYPEIDFTRSVMAGDTVSDMIFGRNLGMVNVLITMDPEPEARELADYDFTDLLKFSQSELFSQNAKSQIPNKLKP